jgi:hypothetical protein
MMKKLLYTLLIGAFVFCMPSCMQIDNFKAPDAVISGRVIDVITGQNVLTDLNHTSIRFQEQNPVDANGKPRNPNIITNPTWQSIPIKHDGTYQNTKLFEGDYYLLPEPNGPWWPTDTVKNVRLSRRATVLDFEVTPLLHLTDFKVVLNARGDSLILSTRIRCHNPSRMVNGQMVNMPPVFDIRPYVSLLAYVGPSNNIHYSGNDDYRINMRNRNWSAIDTDGDGFSDITIAPSVPGNRNEPANSSGSPHTWAQNGTFFIRLPINKGYTYRVRMGASARGGSAPSNSINSGNRYNLSEVLEIFVPN